MSLTRGIAIPALVSVIGAFGCASASPAHSCEPAEEGPDVANYHVLPGAEVTYEFSPPANGPHLSGTPESGIRSEPLDEPLQVAALEHGDVIVQYTSDLGVRERDQLEGLTSDYDNLIVAPASRAIDDGKPVAVTAWGYRQLCDGADLAAIRAFIRDHATGADDH